MPANWSLKKRLSFTFATILLMASALFGLAILNLGKMRDATHWNTHTYKVLAEGSGMLLSMVNIETGLRGFVASGDEKFLEPLTQGQEAFRGHFDRARSLTSDNPGQQARLDKMQASHKQFIDVAASLMTLRRDVNAGKSTSDELLRNFRAGRDKAAMDAFRAEVAAFTEVEASLLSQRSEVLDGTSTDTTLVLELGGLGLGGLTLALAAMLMRSVFRQLGGEPGAAARMVDEVSRGNLSVHIDVKPGDATSLMARLADMRSNLARVVSDVRRNSESVAAASAQIAQGNQDLSQRTEEQASALQQTAATMDELSATVRHTADNARQANQLAGSASAVAAKGGEVVGQVVGTMRNINESSKKIADIIGVIDGIAFQTNILALNAAVEAARAGEQGRGFAVVASEVRSLAQRSAEAAKEIKTLITHSVGQVEQGTSLVGEAGETMEQIVSAIGRVSDIVGEISSASTEQSAGVTQVGQAVSQMDQVTQQNAALVEEGAAAAESLRQQAGNLMDAVSVFKLAGAEGLTVAPVQPSRLAPPAPGPRTMAARKPTARTDSPRAPSAPSAPAPAPAPTPLPASATARVDADAWETF